MPRPSKKDKECISNNAIQPHTQIFSSTSGHRRILIPGPLAPAIASKNPPAVRVAPPISPKNAPVVGVRNASVIAPGTLPTNNATHASNDAARRRDDPGCDAL
eukprot:CAMPEP_0194343800 /NCGR_PEP_ID=MMETSP0171-20130528/98587_1 /TAXON_ID=218684 /ORGANISM="Corethron pennatum, Strain L29A3" /LENGTH=102 /DNA_ID=CAMNT_0039110177 /DNA_START=195 /DNA_END=500 /DNA_ORIENTATION=-